MQPATLLLDSGGVNWEDPAYGTGTEGYDVVHKRVKKEFVPQALADGHFTRPDHIMKA